MEPYPRAIVTADIATGTTSRTVTITVPLPVEPGIAEGRPGPGMEDRLLAAMRRTVTKLGADLDADAGVWVERVDGELFWCRITTPVAVELHDPRTA